MTEHSWPEADPDATDAAVRAIKALAHQPHAGPPEPGAVPPRRRLLAQPPPQGQWADQPPPAVRRLAPLPDQLAPAVHHDGRQPGYPAPPSRQAAPPRQAPLPGQAAPPRQAPPSRQAAPPRQAPPSRQAAPPRQAPPSRQAAPPRQAARPGPPRPAWAGDRPQPGYQADPSAGQERTRRRSRHPRRRERTGPEPASSHPAKAVRTGKPVRHQDPEPGPATAARQLAEHLVITEDRVLAYYMLPLQRWSFRPEAERAAMVTNMAARLAQLTGRRCHLRVTSQPHDSYEWASALDASMRGPFDAAGRPSRQVMPGPCQLHPERSDPDCDGCVPGAPWLDWLQIQQRRIRQWGIADRQVYLGVEVTSRSALRRALGDKWTRAAAAERSALYAQATKVDSAVAGAGLDARPVTADELRWLFLRSCGLHLPAPMPLRENPAPFPYALPGPAPRYAGEDDLDAYADDFPWSAEPFGQTVQVTRGDGRTAYVVVLTITDMPAGQPLAAESPWIQRTDQFDFPVEWSVTFDVLDRRQIQRLMNRQADKIRAQYHHVVEEHEQDPPPNLDRQMVAVRRIQSEADNPESAATYVWAWPRLAVAGDTPEQARQRAGLVAEKYAPGITVKQPPDQYKILREFIPGEPLASAANRRFLHLEFLASGMPTATAQVGHRDGFPLGVTSRLACQAVTWNPFRSMEVNNASGLVTVTGTLGGGKSSTSGLIASMIVRAGITTVILDPSGMLDKLCAIPALQRHALSANILESPPGTLCPYRLISDPVRERFYFDYSGHRVDPDTAEDRWRQACNAAEVQRRSLAADILRMLLPSAMATPNDEKALREAVRRAPATLDASPRDVIAELAVLTDFGLGEYAPLVARELQGIAEHPLARLFFPSAEGGDFSAAGHLLTVMTLQGLAIPDDDRRPEERTAEEQLSIPVLHLAAQLLQRVLFDLPRGQRKAAVLDEAHALTRDAVGRPAA